MESPPPSLSFGGCLVVLVWLPRTPLLDFRLALVPVLVCLLPTCMSHQSSNHDGGVELHISLPGGIQVSVRAPSSSASVAADLLGYISLFQSSSTQDRSGSFELVSSVAGSVSPTGSRGRPFETRDSILGSFASCPPRLFVHSSRLCGSTLSGKDRISRAWLAGQWASAVRTGRIGSPNRTPAIDLRPRFYAVLRAPGLPGPTIFRSSASYWRCIGSLEGSSSISQSFPSEIEAKIYLEAAGEADVEILP